MLCSASSIRSNALSSEFINNRIFAGPRNPPSEYSLRQAASSSLFLIISFLQSGKKTQQPFADHKTLIDIQRPRQQSKFRPLLLDIQRPRQQSKFRPLLPWPGLLDRPGDFKTQPLADAKKPLIRGYFLAKKF
jgi:hypothetical protein